MMFEINDAMCSGEGCGDGGHLLSTILILVGGYYAVRFIAQWVSGVHTIYRKWRLAPCSSASMPLREAFATTAPPKGMDTWRSTLLPLAASVVCLCVVATILRGIL